jgi:hypothetical protein
MFDKLPTSPGLTTGERVVMRSWIPRLLLVAALALVVVPSHGARADGLEPIQGFATLDGPIPLDEAIVVESVPVPSKASTLYPYVESVSLQSGVATLGGDPLIVDVYVVNPSASVVSGATIQLELREPASGYLARPSAVTVSLPASSTTLVPVEWTPDVVLDGLQLDIRADVQVPFGKAPGECGNLIVNGTFDTSCGGWTLVNNNPPGYGAKCSFGYMDVYSTIYNTVPNRYAAAYQALLFPEGSDPADWTLQFRARYSTQSGIYGYGVAQTFVQFLHDNQDGTASVIGEYVQFGSPISAPPNTPTRIFNRVQERVWFTFQLNLGELMSRLAMTASVDGILIGAMAYPACSLSNCNPSANTFLDDVALYPCSAAASALDGTVIVTSLDQTIIGDREAIIRDCFRRDPSEQDVWADLVPFSSALNMWDGMIGNICAAGVYEDDGDDIAANFALFFAVAAYFDPFFELAGFLHLQAGGSVLQHVASSTIERGVLAGATGSVRQAMAGVIGTPAKSTILDERALALRRALDTRPGPWSGLYMVDGPTALSVSAEGRTSTIEVFSHLGIGVHALPDEHHQIVDVGDSIRALDGNHRVPASTPMTFSAVALEPGFVDLRFVTNVGSRVSLWTYPTIEVATGDLVTWGNPDPEGNVEVHVDLGGDGSIDTSILGTPLGATGVDEITPVARRVLSEICAQPNPFNPRTELTLHVSRAADVVVTVVDARGRRVRTLHSGRMDLGRHALTWDGLDDQSNAVASGVYHLRASSGAEVLWEKVALIR